MSDEPRQQGPLGDGSEGADAQHRARSGDLGDHGGPRGRPGRSRRTTGGAPRVDPTAAGPPGSTRPSHAHRSESWLPAPGRGSRRPRIGLRRLLPTWRMVLGGLLLLGLVLMGGLILGLLLVDIPKANKAATAQSNVYLYADGSLITREGEVNRENISLAEVPKHTQRAVLAAEDRNFYSQPGIDLKAVVRAGWNMLQGGGKQSGSTITQQYVKNYYLDQDRTLARKVKEFFIAVKLDREVSKREILEGYLNTSYFGRNAYGIQAAAQAYYDKPASELTVAEGAYLAAVINAPSLYDTHIDPDNRKRAVKRWHYVLNGMVKEGWLTAAKRAELTFPDPEPVKPPMALSGQRGYLVQAVRQRLIEQKIVSERELADGGYRITTTLRRDTQQALVDAVDERLNDRRSEDREVDSYVRAGGTSIDPRTGEVVAMYGGIDYTKQYVNNATRRDFQVGSTFKPFVLASALEHESRTQDGRLITPRTPYDGTSGRQVVGPDGPIDFAPENEDDRDFGRIPVDEAMNQSVNSVFAQMGVDVGPQRVADTAVKLGIPGDTPGLRESAGSISLGTATASTLDMAEAYATLANHGEHTPHRLLKKVSREGETIELNRAESERAISRKAADTTTEVLRGVVEDDGGTGAAAREAGRPAAGKTGTAEEDKAAWFAGYTPELATVVAVMGQHPETAEQRPLYGALGESRINGGGPPAEIWAAYTAAALRGEPERDFDLAPLSPGRDEPGDQPTGQTPTGTPTPPPDGPSGPPDGPPTSPPPTDGETPEPPPSPTDPPPGGGPTEPPPDPSTPPPVDWPTPDDPTGPPGPRDDGG